MLKKRLRVIFCAVVVFFLFISVFTVLAGCSGGGGDSAKTVDPNAVNANGIRNDIQQYIDATYPNSAKNKRALTEYAKILQSAYTNVTTVSEAQNTETEIIRALNCIRFVGEVPGDDAPAQKINRLTSNTPERLEKQLQYERLLEGKVFTISSPGDTPQGVCGFDPDSLPN